MMILLRLIFLVILELISLSIFRLFYKGIFFMQAIFFLITISILLALIVFVKVHRNKLSKEISVIWNLVILSALGFSLFFVGVVPTMADRSISVYLLASIDSQKLKADDILLVVGDTYMDKDEMGRRIGEQLSLGNVKIDKGVYVLTGKGKFFNNLDKLMTALYDLNPKYTQGAQ